MEQAVEVPSLSPDLGVHWRHDFAALGTAFFTGLRPSPLPEPRLVSLNAPLAAELGLSPARLAEPDWVEVLAGNAVPAGRPPLAIDTSIPVPAISPSPCRA